MWKEVVAPGIADVCKGRDWLRERLKDDGFKVLGGTVANHVLIDLEDRDPALAVWKRLQERGVYVRGGMEPPLERHLLVTCGPVDLMRQFYTEFLGVVGKVEEGVS
jgi:histidinol-phosphate/aromatic aminotransferase/cobyric acid decarboxylase-like protein